MPLRPGTTNSAMFHSTLILMSENVGSFSTATSHSTLIVATGLVTSFAIHPSSSTIQSRASAKIFGHSPIRAPHAMTQSMPAFSALPSARR